MNVKVSKWQPQAGPQSILVNCPIETITYGGSRGGGKTVGMILKNCFKAAEYGRDQKGIFFRKELPQLEAAIETCKEIYLPLGWTWAEQKKTFTAPNGATLKFRPLERDSDAEKYQGHEYTDLYFEELTNWASPDPINRLRATMRSGAGVPCQFHATCNPGGPGHQWVKAWIVDPCPAGYKTLKDEFGNERIFIPAKVSDNTALMQADPNYVNRIRQSGSKELVKAWLDGDWNIVEGAFFDCWSTDMVHRPFLVPKEWTRMVSFDWGSAKPFSVGWWAVVQDDYTTPDGVLLPRGYLLRYREWYGVKYEAGQVKPDVGLRMTAEAVGDGIRERTTEKINSWVADPAIFKEDGGPSQAERMKLPFHGADNTRVGRDGHMGGWDQLRSRMIGTRSFGDNGQINDDGVPMIGCFNTCTDSIRTIPSLQHDKNRAEDLDCWVAGTMVSTPDGDIPIEDINVGQMVHTPIGDRTVTASYLSGAGETVKLTFSDGRVLQGTPDHKIYIKSKGLVALNDILCYDIPEERNKSWQQKLLSTMVSFTGAMKGAGTTIQTAITWLTEQKTAFIGRSGRTLETPFQTSGTYTTLMATETTTPWGISNVYQQSNTSESTIPSEKCRRVAHDGKKRQRENELSAQLRTRCLRTPPSESVRAIYVKNRLLLNNLGRFIAPINALKLLAANKLKRLVQFAIPSFGQEFTAQKKSKPVHISAVGRSDASTKVYNLTVDHIHLFYANGVVSSNTSSEDHPADDWRYMAMSRPWRENKQTAEVIHLDAWGRYKRQQSNWKTA